MNNEIVIAGIALLGGGGGVVAFVNAILSHKREIKRMNLEALDKEHAMKQLQIASEKAITELSTGKVPLIYDNVFSDLRDVRYYFMHEFSMEDEGRTSLVREEVVHKVDIWTEELFKANQRIEKCMSECQGACQECTRLESVHLEQYESGIVRYRGWYKRHAVSIEGTPYTETDSNTMEVLATKFEEKHHAREMMVYEMIKKISNSKAYGHDCRQRAKDINKVYGIAFVEMKLDLIDSAIELNGELTGKEFLGYVVGDLSKEYDGMH